MNGSFQRNFKMKLFNQLSLCSFSVRLAVLNATSRGSPEGKWSRGSLNFKSD